MRVQGEVVVDASSQVGTASAPQLDQDGRSIDMHRQRHLLIESLHEYGRPIITLHVAMPITIHLEENFVCIWRRNQ